MMGFWCGIWWDLVGNLAWDFRFFGANLRPVRFFSPAEKSYRRCSLPNFQAGWPISGAWGPARAGAGAWLRGRAASFCVAQGDGIMPFFSIFATLPIRHRSRVCCWPALGASGQTSNCGPGAVSAGTFHSIAKRGLGLFENSVCARRFFRFCNSLRAAAPSVRCRGNCCCHADYVRAAAPLARDTVRCNFFAGLLLPISLRFFFWGSTVPHGSKSILPLAALRRLAHRAR